MKFIQRHAFQIVQALVHAPRTNLHDHTTCKYQVKTQPPRHSGVSVTKEFATKRMQIHCCQQSLYPKTLSWKFPLRHYGARSSQRGSKFWTSEIPSQGPTLEHSRKSFQHFSTCIIYIYIYIIIIYIYILLYIYIYYYIYIYIMCETVSYFWATVLHPGGCCPIGVERVPGLTDL